MEIKRFNRKQKEQNDFQYYKDRINKYAVYNSKLDNLFSEDKHRNLKINYDLFNGKLNTEDFLEVCENFFNKTLILPKSFSNKDILSGKIKALLGMEMRRPFSWRIIAVNEEATTRKEQEEFNRIRDYVVDYIMGPIKEQINQQVDSQIQQLQQQRTEENSQEIDQQIQDLEAQKQEQLKVQTPEEVKLYMERDHQDPAEVLAHQLLRYLFQKLDLKNKFNDLWKHGLISGREIMWIGVENKEPVLKVINPINFNCGKSENFIEDASWASYTEYLTLSDIILKFDDLIKDKDIESLQEQFSEGFMGNTLITDSGEDNIIDFGDLIPVTHCEWKDLKPLKFLKYVDLETGEEFEEVVDEAYKLNKEAGDISLETIWIPALFEGWKVGNDIYIGMREVPGQTYKDDNNNGCKLSYKGIYFDNLNSASVSLLDRMKEYQYLYNIIILKIEQLIASDKGKITFLKSSLIPLQQTNMTLEEWFDTTFTKNLGLVDDNVEGGRPTDITQSVKEVDLSLISDIEKYIQLGDYIERRCGESVGITKQIEGQIGSNEAVRNTQQALIQSANILEPYFELHNVLKKNALQALIEKAKVVYATYQPKTLSYILDDFSQHLLSPDYDLLDNSMYGIFISDSGKTDDILNTVKQMAHAVMQNQMIELSDLIKVLKVESIPEAEELLKSAEKTRQENMQQQQQQQQQHLEQMQQQQTEWEKEKMMMEHQFNIEAIKVKGEIELQKQAMLSVGFNPDKDLDKDGIPDVIEIYKAKTNVDIKQQEVDLRKEELEQKKHEHDDKIEVENKKIENQVLKNKLSNK